MQSVKDEVLARLRQMGIAFDLFEHAPGGHHGGLPAGRGSAGRGNAQEPDFSTPRNHCAHYLVIARAEAPFRTGSVSRQLGASRLSFASPEELEALMRTRPGAISPMGLLFDDGAACAWESTAPCATGRGCCFTPASTRATLALSGADFFERFLPALGYAPTFVDMEGEEKA